jgi:ubiquinol-cytochrome c reductase cytochrome b/c1 subunit
MAGLHKSEFANPVINWVDTRLPIFTMLQKEYGVFPTPKNFNYFWNFGALAMVCLMVMILTGIFLAMNYQPNTELAFASVQHIMRDVSYGWLIRYVHQNGASMFFIVTYTHIFRSLYYGSYKAPRELLWMLGVVILLLMMATAFMGYVLPWGQMSYWGATVITNLFSVIPWIGPKIVTLLWGGFSVDQPTLNRFFALHYLLPFVMVGVIFLHVAALHIVGSNNPLGIDVKTPQDTVPFHPYYTLKDSVGVCVFLMIWAGFVCFAPNFLGDPNNFIPANPLQTPADIVPEWYFLPFYGILRAFPGKGLGVALMFGSLLLLLVLPWLDTSRVRSARFRPIYRNVIWLWIGSFVLLGVCGAHKPEGIWVILSRIATIYYFGHLLVVMPILGKIERPLPLPESISNPVVVRSGLIAALVAAFFGLQAMQPAVAESAEIKLPEQKWSFDGVFGTVDMAAAQRGFKVYAEVCAACHAMKFLHYRDLAGIGLSPEQIKAFASSVTVPQGLNDEGAPKEGPATPASQFRSPFPNDVAARYANNGALPPDLSLIANAREGGVDYIYALMIGFAEPPKGMKMQEGMNYNMYYPGHQIAMPQPLRDGQVAYTDGSPTNLAQMSRDVSTFLYWASNPEETERKQIGIRAILYLGFMGCVTYALKRKVWAAIH